MVAGSDDDSSKMGFWTKDEDVELSRLQVCGATNDDGVFFPPSPSPFPIPRHTRARRCNRRSARPRFSFLPTEVAGATPPPLSLSLFFCTMVNNNNATEFACAVCARGNKAIPTSSLVSCLSHTPFSREVWGVASYTTPTGGVCACTAHDDPPGGAKVFFFFWFSRATN